MGKEVITLKFDKELMERLRAAGVEPAIYLERLLKRDATLGETPAAREARAAVWRETHRAELESYDEFIATNGLWCDDLRQF